MTKESIIELQCIDCNCNDCVHLSRNIARLNTVRAEDDDNQYWFFRRIKARRIWSAREKIKKDKEKGQIALESAIALEYNYTPQTCAINYGLCGKLKKEVSFIPNTLQLETQGCFEHRRKTNLPH